MPAQSKGSWVRSKVKLQDFNVALMSLLSRLLVPSSLLTSHSAKATMLSWACWFGIPAADRSTLGYHKVPGQASMRSYSRDALLHPLHLLMSMLVAYREGSFTPGVLNRSRNMIGPAPPVIEPPAKALADGDVEEADTPDKGSGAGDEEASASASSSSEEAKSESGSEAEVRALAAAETLAVKAKWDGMVYENRTSFMVHLGHAGRAGKFMCNRNMSESYKHVAPGSSPPWKPRCSQCHGVKLTKKKLEIEEIESETEEGVWV